MPPGRIYPYPLCLSRDSLWSRGDPPGIAKDTQEVVKMRRIRSVVAVAAVTAAMAAFAGPAMADVDFDDVRHERFEERLDERADRIEDFYDEVEDAYEDGFLYYDVDDLDDLDDLDVYWALD
jgi:hypothetical protein